MGDADLGVISTHPVTESWVDEITWAEDPGWKLGGTYLRCVCVWGDRWKNESEVKEPEKVIRGVGREPEMKSIIDRVGCQPCGMPKRGKGEWRMKRSHCTGPWRPCEEFQERGRVGGQCLPGRWWEGRIEISLQGEEEQWRKQGPAFRPVHRAGYVRVT